MQVVLDKLSLNLDIATTCHGFLAVAAVMAK